MKSLGCLKYKLQNQRDKNPMMILWNYWIIFRSKSKIKQIKNELDSTGKRYWKSLDNLADTPGFKSWVELEFPEGASMLEGVQRRGFMKLMAASFGLAGLGMTGCRRPEHTIMPYGKSPEELIPGVPNFYATSMPSPHGNIPLIV